MLRNPLRGADNINLLRSLELGYSVATPYTVVYTDFNKLF